MDLVSVCATVQGRVRGVFFRAFVKEQAEPLGLKGYVRNLPSGDVEVVAEGERDRVEKLIAYLRAGPPAAKVTGVEVRWSDYAGKYASFKVRY